MGAALRGGQPLQGPVQLALAGALGLKDGGGAKLSAGGKRGRRTGAGGLQEGQGPEAGPCSEGHGLGSRDSGGNSKGH